MLYTAFSAVSFSKSFSLLEKLDLHISQLTKYRTAGHHQQQQKRFPHFSPFLIVFAALLAQGCANFPTEAQTRPLPQKSSDVCDKGAYWCAGGISAVWGRS